MMKDAESEPPPEEVSAATGNVGMALLIAFFLLPVIIIIAHSLDPDASSGGGSPRGYTHPESDVKKWKDIYWIEVNGKRLLVEGKAELQEKLHSLRQVYGSSNVSHGLEAAGWRGK